MQDFDNSVHFNFSRFTSSGWNNLGADERSVEASVLKASPQENLRMLLPSEPPRPSNIYSCIESEGEDESIREVQFAQSEPEAKHVNPKQYMRMMKMRIKKAIMHAKKPETDELYVP